MKSLSEAFKDYVQTLKDSFKIGRYGCYSAKKIAEAQTKEEELSLRLKKISDNFEESTNLTIQLQRELEAAQNQINILKRKIELIYTLFEQDFEPRQNKVEIIRWEYDHDFGWTAQKVKREEFFKELDKALD